jgi:hypothetical protein
MKPPPSRHRLLLGRLRALFRRPAGEAAEIVAARSLIRAIDAGGVPLNPARINNIARSLGLEVSARAAQEETIERIRAALQRIR